MPYIATGLAANCTVNASDATPETDTEITVTVTVLDQFGRGLQGIPAASVVLASTGASYTLGQPSGVTDQYGRITGTYEASTSGARTISATVLGAAVTDTASVDVAGSTAELLRADWGTALGPTDAALLDGVFDFTTENATPPNVLNVVENTGLDWTRTANVLRATHRGETGGLVVKDNVYDAGTSHYGRVYVRSDETTWNNNHPFKYGSGLSGAFITLVPITRFTNGAANSFPLRAYYQEDGSANAYPYLTWNPGSDGGYHLALGTWYRFEWHLQFKSTTAYRIFPRIYNMAGTLLYDASSYYAPDQSPAYTLQDYYDDGFWFGVASGSPSSIEQFAMGNEGPATTTDTGGHYYFADLVLYDGGWIGDAT